MLKNSLLCLGFLYSIIVYPSPKNLSLWYLQILDALLSPVLDVMPSSSASNIPFLVYTYSVEDNITFMPSIQHGLPHLWKQNNDVSSKAVKSDNALVPTFMWDARIFSLFPSFTSPLLHTLHQVVLVSLFKNCPIIFYPIHLLNMGLFRIDILLSKLFFYQTDVVGWWWGWGGMR